jgi:hypothetical protein
MHRRRFRLVAILPIALLVVILAWWARSYLPEDFYCSAARGRVLLFFVNHENSQMLQPANTHYVGTYMLWSLLSGGSYNAVHLRFLGVEIVATPRGLVTSHVLVAVPFGWVVLPLALASAWSVVEWRRRRYRDVAGRCSVCGYDLRGSRERCPECGTAVPPATAPADIFAGRG